MKLGTGYPFGPFEWARSIGRAEVLLMLKSLEAFHQNIRYQPAPLLAKQSQ
jgi:3-hydroxybutyryl-CoA dehydrogenase